MNHFSVGILSHLDLLHGYVKYLLLSVFWTLATSSMAFAQAIPKVDYSAVIDESYGDSTVFISATTVRANLTVDASVKSERQVTPYIDVVDLSDSLACFVESIKLVSVLGGRGAGRVYSYQIKVMIGNIAPAATCNLKFHDSLNEKAALVTIIAK